MLVTLLLRSKKACPSQVGSLWLINKIKQNDHKARITNHESVIAKDRPI